METYLHRLNRLMKEAKLQRKVYQPGRYWEKYSKRIINAIKDREKLENFLGESSIYCKGFINVSPTKIKLGLLSKLLLRAFSKTSFFKNIPFLMNLLQSYSRADRCMLTKFFYSLVAELDPFITNISSSPVGNPLDVVEINGSKISFEFLRHYTYFLCLNKLLDFSKINYILEIGGGYGRLVEVIKRRLPNITYTYCDIFPTFLCAEFFLENTFGRKELVLAESSKNKDSLKISEFTSKILVLPNWYMEKIVGEIDLFINSASFQEMEKSIVENYAGRLLTLNPTYINLFTLREGHAPRIKGYSDKVDKRYLITVFTQKGYSLIYDSDADMFREMELLLNLFPHYENMQHRYTFLLLKNNK